MKPSKKQCESNVRARATALQTLIAGDDTVDQSLVKACRTVVAFQRYSRQRSGITAFGSRNTLIKYANSVLEDEADGKSGWQYLNELRQAVHQKFGPKLSPRSAVERHRRDMASIRDLTSRLDHSERMLLSQSKAYLWILQELSGLARSQRFSKDARERVYVLLKSHTETFGHLFDPDTEIGNVGDNVVGIRDR